MQRYPDYTRQRLSQVADRLRSCIYPQTCPVDELLVSDRCDRISHDQATQLAYRPAQIGEQFGPLWATFWFRVKATVPKAWRGKTVDLLWVSHSEATLWVDGKSVQGLNHETSSQECTRPDARLLDRAQGGDRLAFQIEMACNKLFGYSANRAPGFTTISPYILERCELALFDPDAWELYHDFLTLQELEAQQARDLDKPWGGRLLGELNRFANTWDPDNRRTWAPARKILKALYRCHNATYAHELSAIGHAHIDTAWLWPLAETYRKCVRSFSTAVRYMDQYPEYKFACSQAQQYAWIKERNPDLYKRIVRKVRSGQFVPVGGTWVEPDCNIPSGESLVRQFLYGQRFFQQEFGRRCKEFWNPDVFGYNGQLPQILLLSGATRFLTQKLSWNRFNKPHHHTFLWEGIDGSKVVTHFPPADSYNTSVTVSELRENTRNYKDHDRSRHSYMLFGFGDGGGGPTKKMIESLRRAKDLQALPRTTIRSSDDFFSLLEEDCTDWATHVGEMYFEYHRGTYTTQAATKKGNRKSEFLLHDLEFLATWAAAKAPAYAYPSQDIERLWKLVLLNQFHDILPGSSIELVYRDAADHYRQIADESAALRDQALQSALKTKSPKAQPAVVNTIGFDRSEVAAMPDGDLVYVQAPSYGLGQITPCPDRVKVSKVGRKIILENRHLRAILNPTGTVQSLLEKSTGWESLIAPGNELLLYEDNPTNFDAWDVDPFHMEQETPCPPARGGRIVEKDPLRAAVQFDRTIGAASSLQQTISLWADSRRLEFHTVVDWHESHRMLKVAFHVDVRATDATYEMQFGTAQRPTHFNTMYDLARYEVPGHKWADLSEHGRGVALLSESKYGFSTFGNTMRISLLRSSKEPDPTADMGRQEFTYAIMPHQGSWREAGVVAEGYRFNVPVLFADAAPAAKPTSFASVNDANLVLDTIKKAQDGDSIILRLYECHGARGLAQVKLTVPIRSATFCNLLEEPQTPATVANGRIEIPYAPYKIFTVKIKTR